MGDARVACDPLVGGQVGPTRTRSRSPARASCPASTPPASQEAASQASPTYSFESERPTTPEPPAEAAEDAKPYDSSCEKKLSPCREEYEIDLELAEERELFGSPSDRSDASGDTLPPMSLPSSLFASPADSQESRPDDDVLLRRSVPPVAPPPPPPVIIVSASAPALNITFNNCASAAVIVRNHVG